MQTNVYKENTTMIRPNVKTWKQAFTEYADAHQGEYRHSTEIKAGAAEIYGKVCTMKASDFAKRETKMDRSKKNPTLFKRFVDENGKEIKGQYYIYRIDERPKD